MWAYGHRGARQPVFHEHWEDTENGKPMAEGSTVATLPDDDTIIGWAKDTLYG